MRRFIPFIGVLLAILAGAEMVNIGPGLTNIGPESTNIGPQVIVHDTDREERARVIDWMGRGSSVSAEILEHIYEEAHKHRFPDLLIAIAKVESDFDPAAVSHAGATGLTQVMARVWERELREEGLISDAEDLFDISRCMASSAYILEKYLNWEGGNLRGALKRYVGANATTGYQEKVLEILAEIRMMKYQTGDI